MDAHAGIHLTRSDNNQVTPVESHAMDHKHDTGTAPIEDPVPYNHSPPSPDVHWGLATHGGDIEAHKEQSPILPFKSDEELEDTRIEGNKIAQEPDCASSESNSDQHVLPMITEDVSPSVSEVVLSGGPLSSTNVDDVLETFTLDESEADSDDHFNPIKTLHAERNQIQDPGPVRTTDEEETREDFDPCDPSLPPSSSPPQLFSSSPCASSQSSAKDIESSNPKTVPAIETDYDMASRDYAHAEGDLAIETEEFHGHDTTKVATSLETNEYCLQTSPTSRIKRSANHDGSQNLEPIKRPKLDSLLPVPKRATLASQNHQFKKLTAPFRPPLKIPIVADELAKTTNSTKVESTIKATPETNRDKFDQKGSTSIFQHKASNTPRSLTQFKSPLVNRILPVDSRSVRLTPALQALERKLQLLRRALKVKEEHEEEVLTGLTAKWIEAGREVAYEVWDAAKDAVDFAGKATSTHRSYGWENTHEGNVPWGWDTKPGDAVEESCDLNSSKAPRTPASVEDDDIGCNTLGTMLRQLGIDPEIFGWDDDKETFSD